MMKKNHSSGMLEAGCSKQMCLSLTSFVFTRGVAKVRVSDAVRNFLAGVYGYMRSEILWEFAREGIEADG